MQNQSQFGKGLNAVNQEFNRYDQVVKLQRYRLSEGQEDLFDEDYQLKVCDIGPLIRGGEEKDKKRFVQDLGKSLEDIGFAVITGHGVDADLYRQVRNKIVDVFENYPLDVKLKYRAQRFGSVNQGYFPIKETTIIHPDMVEGWVFCRRAFDIDNNPSFKEEYFWPAKGLESFFREVVLKHEKLILPVMQSILQYLNVDSHLYDKKLTGTNFGFRLNYYPPVTDEDGRGGRMLGHEDVDLFTILPASDVEGLQALHRGTMKWVRVNAPEGSIILNTGDYMQRISNDRLPSTTHRVSNPRNTQLNSKPRISFPMAVYVWEDEVLEVIPGLGPAKYEPVSAIDFHTRTTSKYYGDDYAPNPILKEKP